MHARKPGLKSVCLLMVICLLVSGIGLGYTALAEEAMLQKEELQKEDIEAAASSPEPIATESFVSPTETAEIIDSTPESTPTGFEPTALQTSELAPTPSPTPEETVPTATPEAVSEATPEITPTPTHPLPEPTPIPELSSSPEPTQTAPVSRAVTAPEVLEATPDQPAALVMQPIYYNVYANNDTTRIRMLSETGKQVTLVTSYKSALWNGEPARLFRFAAALGTEGKRVMKLEPGDDGAFYPDAAKTVEIQVDKEPAKAPAIIKVALNKSSVLVKEPIQYSIYTNEDTTRVRLLSETGALVTQSANYQAAQLNGEAVRLFRFCAALGTEGERVLKAEPGDTMRFYSDSGTNVQIQVTAPVSSDVPSIDKATVNYTTVVIKEPFAYKVYASSLTTRVQVLSEAGVQLTYATNYKPAELDGKPVRLFEFSMALGTKGERTLRVEAGDASRYYSESAKNVQISVIDIAQAPAPAILLFSAQQVSVYIRDAFVFTVITNRYTTRVRLSAYSTVATITEYTTLPDGKRVWKATVPANKLRDYQTLYAYAGNERGEASPYAQLYCYVYETIFGESIDMPSTVMAYEPFRLNVDVRHAVASVCVKAEDGTILAQSNKVEKLYNNQYITLSVTLGKTGSRRLLVEAKDKWGYTEQQTVEINVVEDELPRVYSFSAEKDEYPNGANVKLRAITSLATDRIEVMGDAEKSVLSLESGYTDAGKYRTWNFALRVDTVGRQLYSLIAHNKDGIAAGSAGDQYVEFLTYREWKALSLSPDPGQTNPDGTYPVGKPITFTARVRAGVSSLYVCSEMGDIAQEFTTGYSAISGNTEQALWKFSLPLKAAGNNKLYVYAGIDERSMPSPACIVLTCAKPASAIREIKLDKSGYEYLEEATITVTTDASIESVQYSGKTLVDGTKKVTAYKQSGDVRVWSYSSRVQPEGLITVTAANAAKTYTSTANVNVGAYPRIYAAYSSIPLEYTENTVIECAASPQTTRVKILVGNTVCGELTDYELIPYENTDPYSHTNLHRDIRLFRGSFTIPNAKIGGKYTIRIVPCNRFGSAPFQHTISESITYFTEEGKLEILGIKVSSDPKYDYEMTMRLTSNAVLASNRMSVDYDIVDDRGNSMVDGKQSIYKRTQIDVTSVKIQAYLRLDKALKTGVKHQIQASARYSIPINGQVSYQLVKQTAPLPPNITTPAGRPFTITKAESVFRGTYDHQVTLQWEDARPSDIVRVDVRLVPLDDTWHPYDRWALYSVTYPSANLLTYRFSQEISTAQTYRVVARVFTKTDGKLSCYETSCPLPK